MAQADAEDRLLAQEAANGGDCIFQWLGVAGAVREEHAVGLLCEHFVGRRGAGHNRHAATLVDQVARDVPLHAEVEGDHYGCASRVESRESRVRLRFLNPGP